MTQQEIEAIVASVTEKVLASMDSAPSEASVEGLDKILVLGGDKDDIPEYLKKNAVTYCVEDYRKNQNTLRYKKIVIKKLNITQLSDIANGRISDDVSSAVIYGLLCGVELIMLEGALSHRRFAGQGSTSLYNMMEEYAKKLQVFGVKAPKAEIKQPAPAKPAKFSAPAPSPITGSAKPNFSRLITEDIAMGMIKCGESCIPDGAIITPSAKDVLKKAGILK